MSRFVSFETTYKCDKADYLGIDNGGPPGVLYEFLVACLYYCFIAASLAEVCHSPNLKPMPCTVPEHSDSRIARLLRPIIRRSLPLGFPLPRSQSRSSPRLLHRLAQLLRLALRPRLDCVHYERTMCTNVRPLPPRLHHQTLEHIRRPRPHHLDLYRHHYLLQQVPPLPSTVRFVCSPSRRSGDPYHGGGDAEEAC